MRLKALHFGRELGVGEAALRTRPLLPPEWRGGGVGGTEPGR